MEKNRRRLRIDRRQSHGQRHLLLRPRRNRRQRPHSKSRPHQNVLHPGGITQLPMSTPEKHAVRAEIKQVLDIVILSLYTEREIFVRELISNAADACEKLRFSQTSGKAIHQPDTAAAIQIDADEPGKKITFTDTGIGMSHDELIENLGT